MEENETVVNNVVLVFSCMHGPQPQVLEGDGPTGCDSSMLPPGSLRTAALCNIICMLGDYKSHTF